MRKGNYITLAELFRYGGRFVSAYHLYQIYIKMDVYIQVRKHSKSMSPNGIERNNAKVLRRYKTGSWALPKFAASRSSSSVQARPPKRQRGGRR